MMIRKLFPLLFAAVAAVVLTPETASAQCWWCGVCNKAAGTAAAVQEQLEETLAAIKAGRSISADGPFVYLRQGADYVVRRRCDAVEMGRVAVADVQSVPMVGAG